MDIFQYIRSNNGMQICIHKIKYKINISIILGSDNILQSNDVFMSRQFLEKNDFSKSPLCICSVLEGIEIFLESHNFLCPFINCFPHNTISSFSKFLKNFIFLQNMCFYFFSHIFLILFF